MSNKTIKFMEPTNLTHKFSAPVKAVADNKFAKLATHYKNSSSSVNIKPVPAKERQLRYSAKNKK